MSISVRRFPVIHDEVRANYLRLWGEPSHEAHFARDGYQVQVYTWDISANPRGAHTYATCGLEAVAKPH
jgi:hypothetical protein